MKKMDAYVAVRGRNNITELSDVPAAKMKLIAKKMRRVQDQRVKTTKCVVLRWPTPSMAQLAGMSTEAFEDLFRCVHTGLPQTAARNEGPQAVDGKDRPCPNQRARHRSAFQHKGNSSRHLRRRPQHSRRRSFHFTSERFR